MQCSLTLPEHASNNITEFGHSHPPFFRSHTLHSPQWCAALCVCQLARRSRRELNIPPLLSLLALLVLRYTCDR